MSLEQSKNPRDVIIAPVITEKSSSMMDEGKYTFLVDPRSNKVEIRLAVEKIFNVKVSHVATQNRQGKVFRTRNGIGRRKNTKRAIVTVSEGSIDIFGDMV